MRNFQKIFIFLLITTIFTICCDDISFGSRYYCKWCGFSFASVASLSSSACSRNPYREKHELYEGYEKSQYACKWCGLRFPSISSLTSCPCNRSPHKRHEPAL